MAQILSDDEETQRKGEVLILVVENEAFSYLSQEHAQREHAEMVRAYPVRSSSSHFCFPDSPFYTLLRTLLMLKVTDEEARLHTRFHTDIGINTQYSLMSVGIPVSEIPLTYNKTIKVKNHIKWIKNRKTLEKAGVDPSHWVEHPQNHDILFRQGGNRWRQGILDFLHMLEPQFDTYFTTSAENQKTIRETAIQDARAKGCRFLQLDREAGLWVEIIDQGTLHKKVYTALYDHRKRLKNSQDRQISQSDTASFLQGRKRMKIEGKSYSMCQW